MGRENKIIKIVLTVAPEIFKQVLDFLPFCIISRRGMFQGSECPEKQETHFAYSFFSHTFNSRLLWFLST